MVFCVGILLAGWTRFVTADSGSYAVYASVPGPAPTVAATIDTPGNQTVATASPILVSGSCPLNTYVTLYRNGVFSGVALCSQTAAYQLSTALFYGMNRLQARVFSFTDVPGPLSNLVTVDYPRPGSPTGPPGPGGTAPTAPGTTSSSSPAAAASTASQPVIGAMFAYQGAYVGQAQSWQLTISNGTPPYAVNVEWGDASADLISRAAAGEFTITHTYQKAGGYHGSYVITITLTDGAGAKTYLQLIAIVNNKPSADLFSSATTTGTTPTQSTLTQTLKYVWPSYALIVLLLASFWLGERQEFHHLRPRLKRARTGRS